MILSEPQLVKYIRLSVSDGISSSKFSRGNNCCTETETSFSKKLWKAVLWYSTVKVQQPVDLCREVARLQWTPLTRTSEMWPLQRYANPPSTNQNPLPGPIIWLSPLIMVPCSEVHCKGCLAWSAVSSALFYQVIVLVTAWELAAGKQAERGGGQAGGLWTGCGVGVWWTALAW